MWDLGLTRNDTANTREICGSSVFVFILICILVPKSNPSSDRGGWFVSRLSSSLVLTGGAGGPCMVSVPALFDRCVSSDQPLINTVKHGSALLLLLLHLSLSLQRNEGEEDPADLEAHTGCNSSCGLAARRSAAQTVPPQRIASHFDAVPSSPHDTGRGMCPNLGV